MQPVRRALLSVYDKRGIVDFARGLDALGVSLVSTGGTAAALREAGLEVIEAADVTGFADTLGGRVKTLHPAIFGAILARREVPEDLASIDQLGMGPIDLVAVNLYPFEEAAARAAPMGELIEKIDIGGPSLIRAAAKNWKSVAVVVSPDVYDEVLVELRSSRGSLGDRTRLRLANEAFARTAAYDARIAETFTQRVTSSEADTATGIVADDRGQVVGDAPWPARISLGGRLSHPLRYGENPHQQGAAYAIDEPFGPPPPVADGVLDARVLEGGAELSFNNLLDLDAAIGLVRDLDRAGRRLGDPLAAASVIKHAGPCGAAVGAALVEAFEGAWSGDPLAAYGSVVALNRPLDRAAAEVIGAKGRFIEALVAPAIAEDAEAWLREHAPFRRRVRLLSLPALGDPPPIGGSPPRSLRTLGRAVLVQDQDTAGLDPDEWEVATKRAPTDAERRDLLIAEVCAKHARSNAITLAREGVLVGACGGAVSRVEAVERAVAKAGERAAGAALGSDAFFPFDDGVKAALDGGVRAFLQPGGSKRDEEAVAAADAADATMVLTGVRHFRH